MPPLRVVQWTELEGRREVTRQGLGPQAAQHGEGAAQLGRPGRVRSKVRVDITNLPPHARWVADVAFIRYTWDGLMLNEFGENDPPFFGGSVLQFYHIRGDKWTRVGVMAAFFCVYMVLAYCALAFVRHMRR